MTFIIGISGGIASGKNYVSDILEKNLCAKIFDADLEVKKIWQNNEIKFFIRDNFPEVIINDEIDKDKIFEIIFSDKKKLEILENKVHPIVAKKMNEFILEEKSKNTKIIILNIPLLFEKNSYKKCDMTILVISDINIRKKRFVAREIAKNQNFKENYLKKKFDTIILNQQSDEEKAKIADFIIKNNSDKDAIINQFQLNLKKYENNNR
jgi:dephospho-CoA kinase